VLTALAWVEDYYGFLLLEGVWRSCRWWALSSLHAAARRIARLLGERYD